MRLFDPRDREITPQQARRYAVFEILHTVVDFAAKPTIRLAREI